MRLRALFRLVVLLPCAAFAAPSDELKSLIDSGKVEDAYQLGRRAPPAPPDALFDYYFGIAAVDSGRAAEGVEILKRFVDRQPSDPRARLELGRGYFLLGDNQSARTEFETVKKAEPPQQVVANIDLYLTAIHQRETQTPTAGITGYVEAGIGYDSNVNGGVSNENIILPTLGTVTVDPSGARLSDSFNRLAFGAQASQPLSGGFGIFASANVDSRGYRTENRFDQLNLVAATGLSFSESADLVRTTVSSDTLEIGHARYRSSNALAVEWQRQLSPSQAVFASAQTARFSYTGDNAVRDADFASLGVGARHAWDAAWQPALTLSFNASSERNLRQRNDLSNDRYALRIGADAKPDPRWIATAGLTWQTSRYREADPILAVARKDDYYALDFSAAYYIDRDLSVRGEVSMADTRSNLALYANKRSVAGVNLKYEFR